MLEDKRLIRDLKRGQQDALQRVYETYKEDLLWIAVGLLRNTSDAEDVVHEVFVTFIRDIRQFTLTGSLKGYLTTCVVNRARNIHRDRARHGAVSLDLVADPVSETRQPDEWILIDEAARHFQDVMDRLPYEQREVMMLRVQGNMKFSTIAALQDTSIKTVISRYRYGISKLRTLLNGEVS